MTRLSVHSDGFFDLNKFEQSIQEETILVSVMHVNNEIGVIQPLREIGAICKERGIILHVDAAQSIGKIPVNVNEMGIDLLSISAHKLYGPKGVGALYMRRKDPRVQLQPIIFGGGHERGIRSGTLAVHNIVGLGRACEMAKKLMNKESPKIKALRNQLLKSILSDNPNIKVNGSMEKRVAGNLNISFLGMNNEAIIAALPEVAISSGAACTTSTMEPSHVLLALGLSKEEAYSSLRFGIGRFNTETDIETAAKAIKRCMNKLTKMSFV